MDQKKEISFKQEIAKYGHKKQVNKTKDGPKYGYFLQILTKIAKYGHKIAIFMGEFYNIFKISQFKHRKPNFQIRLSFF